MTISLPKGSIAASGPTFVQQEARVGETQTTGYERELREPVLFPSQVVNLRRE